MDLKNSMSVAEVVHPKVAVVQWQALVDVGKKPSGSKHSR
jgi:hypothetical protein